MNHKRVIKRSFIVLFVIIFSLIVPEMVTTIAQESSAITPIPNNTIYVNTTDNIKDGTCDEIHCSLRDAIVLANSYPDNELTHIILETTTYALDAVDNTVDWIYYGHPTGGNTALPIIEKHIGIIGNGATITRNSTQYFRFFLVDLYGSLYLEDLTISNGDIGPNYVGGAVRSAGKLTIENVNFINNQGRVGGGVAHSIEELNISNSLFANNYAYGTSSGWGGAIFRYESSINYTAGPATISNNRFINNIAQQRGGAIFTGNNMTITENAFIGNTIVDFENGFLQGSVVYAGTMNVNASVRKNCIVNNNGIELFAYYSQNLSGASDNWWGNPTYSPNTYKFPVTSNRTTPILGCPSVPNLVVPRYDLETLIELDSYLTGIVSPTITIRERPPIGLATVQNNDLIYTINVPTFTQQEHFTYVVTNADGLEGWGIVKIYPFFWDLNRDGEVTPEDAIYIINQLDETTDATNRSADLNDDGVITLLDLQWVLANYGAKRIEE